MTAAQRGTPGRGPRVLILSALMGGGHNAAGRAVEEAVRRNWPGSQVDWVDVLAIAGPGMGPALRGLYVANIQRTPALYRFFYASLWRQPWFADAAKRTVAAWFGRVLSGTFERLRPDLVVSTYPMASAGLAWLRRHRQLPMPTAALVCDIAPHPFWVYPELDVNLVIHPMAAPLARAAAPAARIEVCDLPVVSAFHPGERRALRRELGLAEDAYIALVSCGSYGFGAVYEATQALLAASENVQTVVVCGRNGVLARRLAALQQPPHRLLRLRWVEDMARLTRAADLVVTNAGGATALEAVASGVRLVMYRPIAAHGEANAALMTAAGLAETYHSVEHLTAAVRALATATAPVPPPLRAAATSLPDALRELLKRSPAPGPPDNPRAHRHPAGTIVGRVRRPRIRERTARR